WNVGTGMEYWWVRLLQANILSGSVASLLWLAVGGRWYEERPAGIARAPLLSFQLLLALAGNAVLLVNPGFVAVLVSPGERAPSVAEADGLWGWLTLGMSAVLAVAHLRLTGMHGAVNVLGALGVAAGVLAACTAAPWDTEGEWLAYHVLMVGW